MSTLDAANEAAEKVIGEARERMQRAFEAFRTAEEKANEAAAEVARLCLLNLAEERPGIKGLSFESEYQYDDEGGYFQTATTYPLVEEGSTEDFDDVFMDEMNFDVATLAVLCGVHPDTGEGQITIEEARAKKF